MVKSSTIKWVVTSFESGLHWALYISVLFAVIAVIIDIELIALVGLGPILGVFSYSIYMRFEMSEEFWFTKAFRQLAYILFK